MAHLEMTLASDPIAPSEARQAVRTWFHSRHCGQDAEATAALLVTELVSNAVVHGTGLTLCLTVDEPASDVLHVAVRDDSHDIPLRPPDEPDVHQASGRGLFMVEALSTSWGWESLPIGKRVWFELSCVTISPSGPESTSE